MARMPDTDMATIVSRHIDHLKPVPYGRQLRDAYWSFDPEWLPMNHGSFGTSPTPISNIFRHYNLASERRPCQFIKYAYPPLLIKSRESIARFLHVPRDELVLVPNATTGINTVLRNLRFKEGDLIAYFSFIYGACGYSIRYVTSTTPAQGLQIHIKLPASADDIVNAFEREVAPYVGRVKLALFDTVTSMPGVRLPFERLVASCKRHNILSLIDGAHGVGLIPGLDLGELDADFTTSNLHKWLFTPRGCAFLHVPRRNQHLVRSTLPTSWGYEPLADGQEVPAATVNGECGKGWTDSDMKRWADMFSSTGTVDTSAYLCVPAALHFRQHVLGGEKAITTYCHGLALLAADLFSTTLGEGADVLDSCAADTAMVNIKIPLDRKMIGEDNWTKVGPWMMTQCVEKYDTYLAVYDYEGEWWVRISAQVYLEEADMVKGANILKKLVDQVKSGEWRTEGVEIENEVEDGNVASNGHSNGHSNGYYNGYTYELEEKLAEVGISNGTNGYTNGHTNGVNGHTNIINGHTNGSNGYTNGYTNGSNGYTNGYTNGHTNGHTNGINEYTNGYTNGHTNGINGHINGSNGYTNGYTNGHSNGTNGYTDGANGHSSGINGHTSD